MTESDWLQCDAPDKMLRFLRHRGADSKRKLRLFAVACCRAILPLLRYRRARTAVDVAEEFADGLATVQQLAAARNAPVVAGQTAGLRYHLLQPAINVADRLARRAAYDTATSAADVALLRTPELRKILMPELRRIFRDNPFGRTVQVSVEGNDEARHAVHWAQANLLRDIFGNPFCLVTIDPAWRTRTVLTLTETAYEERHLPSGALNSVVLAALGDTLEEAGCTNTDILAHLRRTGPHTRLLGG